MWGKNISRLSPGKAWKGSSPGGHHRRGVLEFPEVKGNPQTAKLIIHGIADVPTMVFEWKLES
jgi:hypothetical protein